MGGDDDTLDLVEAPRHLGVQRHCRLAGSLGVELRREGELEEDVFHHIAAEAPLEAEAPLRLGLGGEIAIGVAELHIVEAPLGRGERTGHAHLAAQGDIGQAHRPGSGIPGGPALARPGVGRMTIGAQALAVDPGVGECCEQLLAVGTQ